MLIILRPLGRATSDEEGDIMPESFVIFIVIVGVILLLLGLLLVRNLIPSVVFILFGIGMIAGGISLLVSYGATATGIGIILVIIGGGSAWFGVSELKEITNNFTTN
jgi:hypothetical protein